MAALSFRIAVKPPGGECRCKAILRSGEHLNRSVLKMKNFLKNKFAQVAVLSLSMFALALNAGTPTPSATPAAINTVAIGPTMPPAPWAGVTVAIGPTMPPAPWAGVADAIGPTMPPAPWAGVAVAIGPTMPPAPWAGV